MTGTKLLGLAALLACGITVASARAQTPIGETGVTVTLTPTLTTDYMFRGLSQTRNRPAAQITAEAAHANGLYVGVFASNFALLGTNGRQEVDVLAGYRFEALGISWDIGAIYYAYPGYDRPPGGYNLNYGEIALRASREIAPVKLMAGVFASPNYFTQSGRSLYLEGGLDVTLPLEFVVQGRLGYTTIQRNERFGTPDYLWWSIGVTRPLPGGFSASLGWYDTNVSRADCLGGQKICAGRVVFSLSRGF